MPFTQVSRVFRTAVTIERHIMTKIQHVNKNEVVVSCRILNRLLIVATGRVIGSYQIASRVRIEKQERVFDCYSVSFAICHLPSSSVEVSKVPSSCDMVGGRRSVGRSFQNTNSSRLTHLNESSPNVLT